MDPPLAPAAEPDLGPSWHMDPDPALFFLVSQILSGASSFNYLDPWLFLLGLH